MVTAVNPTYYPVMNHEIELKLRLNTSELPLLEQALASNQFIAEPILRLFNRYFDTPTMNLSQGGAALRIRQQGVVDSAGRVGAGQIIQTLKTRGTSSAGLHQRMEWDWPLAEVALDLNLIRHSAAQSHLSAELELTHIAPLFSTDFQRKMWLYQQGETLIELVLDQGQVATDEHAIDLLELELELKQGDAQVLFQVAQQLAEQCPVVMSDISKAERGYGLLARSQQYSQIKKDWVDKLPHFDPQQDVMSCCKTFFAYQLVGLQRSLEFCIWDNQQHQQERVVWQMTQLHNLLTLFTHIDCLPETQLLQRQIAGAQQAPLEISLIWGPLSLACGQWLYNLSADETEFEMTAQEQALMRLHTEQLLKGVAA